MGADLWALVLEGTSELALQALMAAAIKHSRLLSDFLIDVVSEHHRTFNDQLSVADWKHFLAECERRDPAVSSWVKVNYSKFGNLLAEVKAVTGE